MNSQQADVYRGLDKHVPPMTDGEAVTILNRSKFWIDDRAKDYMKRSRGYRRQFHQELLAGCCQESPWQGRG
ncbi:MAG: hypothetical protein ACJ0DK_09225 [Planctomycetota bacterium]